MVDRIKQVMEHYEETPAGFAEKIGVNRSNLTHVFSGRNQPSLDFAKKVLVAFPEVSTEWLIMGVGKMIKDPDDTPVVKREFIQTDLFGAMDEEETVAQAPASAPVFAYAPAPEPQVKSMEKSEEKVVAEPVTNGKENDVQASSDDIPLKDVKQEVPEISPSEEVQKTETKDVKSKKEVISTSLESNIQNPPVPQSRKIDSRQVEHGVAQEEVKPDSRAQAQAQVVSQPKSVSEFFNNDSASSQSYPSEKPQTPKEKKIEKIIFFYDDDSFKVYHP